MMWMLATLSLVASEGAVPGFECPDAAINKTYEYRWKAFKRHCEKTPDGWVVTKFLPKVPWSGPYNTIVCPAGHHLREARWMDDKSVAADYARFWFGTNGWHRRQYSSWLGSAVLDVVRVSGDTKLAVDLLDLIAANYTAWEEDPKTYRTCSENEPFPMGGDGKGMFTSVDDREGSEYSLGRDGYKPLFNSAMWGEARAIVEIARIANRSDLVANLADLPRRSRTRPEAGSAWAARWGRIVLSTTIRSRSSCGWCSSLATATDGTTCATRQKSDSSLRQACLEVQFRGCESTPCGAGLFSGI